MSKNRKLFKSFVSSIRNHQYTAYETRERIKELPIKVLRRVGKKIIYAEYDGYNYSNKYSELVYFDNLNRWQKEFFIEQNLYKLRT